MHTKSGLLASLIVGMACVAGAITLVNVDFNDDKDNSWWQLNNVTYVGQGNFRWPGFDYWNGIVATNGVVTANLIAADGVSDSGIQLEFTDGVGGSESNTKVSRALPSALMGDYIRTQHLWNQAKITITRLIPGMRYDLCLYGGRGAGEATLFTVPGCGALATWSDVELTDDQFWDATNKKSIGNISVVFKNVKADANGSILYQFERATDYGDRGFHSALQIRKHVPDGSVFMVR